MLKQELQQPGKWLTRNATAQIFFEVTKLQQHGNWVARIATTQKLSRKNCNNPENTVIKTNAVAVKFFRQDLQKHWKESAE